MLIEKWKDTVFGSDYGGDFKDFLEGMGSGKLTLSEIYKHCDLKKYFDNPILLNQSTDHNVQLENPDFEQFVHYEDAVIALTAIVVECELNGSADLKNAYGSKILSFEIGKPELIHLKNALAYIYGNAEKFVLFEMCSAEEREEALSDIAEIIEQLENCISKK
ncbi:imm68 putative immunity domain-containing protein [Flavobacterium reichenbachii]|uniref:Uncharacterized protein n=1 Tax=Flavobacterium reichenbachii TaxID=362418 RepID=A0A085ZSV0_9FLAO|nr:imm68 putative immunity domain-containing protein [Flavobacterium reichenbachii]KFF07514.1 hypothetical protein IW19_19270 [Flavobacterium reichenbachii]OXB14154.1 hypothetical protein B0A68_13095 [Flavobacterium reichenbachii]